ncbi:serine/threonine-protein kinase PknD [Mycobacterium sp. Marseille-P9652]|uniref:serine/threonine-protein kinase PknD n=1 Tax=Mycobacterium sp. Marseille-P9652 TaxID=2654950 RepID=UPI0012E93B00|nr:serine/threonine-protein kinase PknD [Mycobacterium sp. Marseille-P9652]
MDGTPFGRYRLLELLRRGGMGEVWCAYDSETDRIVALKLLPPNLSEDEDFQVRFRREAHAAARLNDPHVIPIHHYGEINGRLYVDMRLIEGRDLGAELAGGPLEPARAVHIIDQIAKALHAAHKVGLIHRDIKPANILLNDDDFAYLIDFGIARAADETRLTQSGNTVGTFNYVAPERLGTRAEEDARADIYSLTCVLYECLTGEQPFVGETLAQLVAAHLNSPPPRPSLINAGVPAQFDEVIARGMAKDPDARYATTAELADAAREAIDAAGQPLATADQARTQVIDQGVRQQAMVNASAPTEVLGGAGPLVGEAAAAGSPGMHDRPTVEAPEDDAPTPEDAPTARGRRTRIALVAGGVAVVAVIVAALGIPALTTKPPAAPPPSQPPAPPTPAPSPQVVLPFTDLNGPSAVAVDGGGVVYVTDTSNNRVMKLAEGAPPTALPFTDLASPEGVAVDGTGNVYVADFGHDRVLELAPGSTTPTVRMSGLGTPAALAVDGAGNLYVADHRNSRVLKLAPGSSAPNVLPLTGLVAPVGLAVSGTGTVYVADSNRVVKLPAGEPAATIPPSTGINDPTDVAVDEAGTLYVSEGNLDRVIKLPAGSSTATELPFTGLSNPCGVILDGSGNLYVADHNNNRVLKVAVR